MERTVKLSAIKRVWESWSGWYWFATEILDDGRAFGLVKGFEIEWGYWSLKELEALGRRGLVWRVPRRNWALCPCVVDDEDREEEQSSSLSGRGRC